MEKNTHLFEEIRKSGQPVYASFPRGPGVYVFKNAGSIPIYIGKASDLRTRLKSYFQSNVPPKTRAIVSQAVLVETIETMSEFDALLLESKLIYDNQPKYNTLAKDDKSPLYVLVTASKMLPEIRLVRKTSIQTEKKGKDRAFGPFQSSRIVRQILSAIRIIVPFCTQKTRNGKPCFYTHIGLCDPCASYIDGLPEGERKTGLKRLYRKNIRKLLAILDGNIQAVRKDLENQMHAFAAKEEFEKAAGVRNKITAMEQLLHKHYDPMLYISGDESMKESVTDELTVLKTILAPYYPEIQDLHRIECFDISNTSGTYQTASMVVLRDGRPDNSQYRKFRLRRVNYPNDFEAMKEAVDRRFNHADWEYPELLVIDGGKGQVHAVQAVLEEKNVTVPVVGLAKRFEDIVIPTGTSFKIISLPSSSAAIKVLQRIRDEAHRFAHAYHTFLRNKASL